MELLASFDAESAAKRPPPKTSVRMTAKGLIWVQFPYRAKKGLQNSVTLPLELAIVQ